MQSKFFLDQFHKIATSFLSSFSWLFKNWGITSIFIFLKPYFFGISLLLDGPLLFLPYEYVVLNKVYCQLTQ